MIFFITFILSLFMLVSSSNAQYKQRCARQCGGRDYGCVVAAGQHVLVKIGCLGSRDAGFVRYGGGRIEAHVPNTPCSARLATPPGKHIVSCRDTWDGWNALLYQCHLAPGGGNGLGSKAVDRFGTWVYSSSCPGYWVGDRTPAPFGPERLPEIDEVPETPEITMTVEEEKRAIVEDLLADLGVGELDARGVKGDTMWGLPYSKSKTRVSTCELVRDEPVLFKKYRC
ncbi:hypothetical protein EDC01DRAFT_233132 [Geopyxis carbonaria]|nr:hypothetical protein EDC01DRAFT_233132 [Geopyxis carbonaria]